MRSFIYNLVLFLIVLTWPCLISRSEPPVASASYRFMSLPWEKNGIAPIELLSPKKGDVLKRGQLIEIRWSGGNPNEKLALDLYNGRFHYRHIGELNNSGVYPWAIPNDIKPGYNYRFKLTNSDDFSEFYFGDEFTIKRKVPLVAWLVPGGIVVASGIILLIAIDPDPGMSDLPPPVEPR